MGLKAALKRLERELSPAIDVTIYSPDGPLLRENGGLVRVISWGKPGEDELINYKESDRRIAAARARGEQVIDIGMNKPFYESDDDEEDY